METHKHPPGKRVQSEFPFKDGTFSSVDSLPKLRILSIDGGGIRGIIPAYILSIVEQRTGKKISDIFHFVTGTSTGGILAAGLAKDDPVPAKDLLDIYLKRGKEIFPPLWFNLPRTKLLGPKYPADGLEKLLTEFCGDTYLSDVSSVALMITAFDIEHGKPFFFKNWKSRNYLLREYQKPEDYDFKLMDTVRATSAAPTYYPHASISNRMGKQYHFVDGGVIANNPAVCAISSVYAIYPHFPDDNIFMVSLGTGLPPFASIDKKLGSGGIVQWGLEISDVLMGGAAEVQDYQMDRIFHKGKNYFRFQVEIPYVSELDDVSDENTQRLLYTAERMLEENETLKNYLDQILDLAKEPKAAWCCFKEFIPKDFYD